MISDTAFINSVIESIKDDLSLKFMKNPATRHISLLKKEDSLSPNVTKSLIEILGSQDPLKLF